MGGWIQVSANLHQIAVGSVSHIWGVGDGGAIWRFTGTPNWDRIDVDGVHALSLDVGADGTTWCVDNETHTAKQFVGGLWEEPERPTRLKSISVGSKDQVIGITDQNHVYRYVGNGFEKMDGAPELQQASVARDGTIFGVTKAGAIFQFDRGSWKVIEGQLSQVAVGAWSSVWGIQNGGEIYRFTGDEQAPWESIEGRAKHVSVGVDGTVWVIGHGNTTIYYYLDSAPVVISGFQEAKTLKPGQPGELSFVATNSAFGTMVLDTKLELLYDKIAFQKAGIKVPEFLEVKELPYGARRKVTFTVDSQSTTPFDVDYAIHGVRTAAGCFAPGLAPSSAGGGGWMTFRYVQNLA